MAQFFEGTPAVLSEEAAFRPLASGSATIAAASNTILVRDGRITANSIILCWGVGTKDTTALSFSADTFVAHTSFNINANAAATADKTVRYAILRY